jgi:chromosome segregation ATPase
MEREVEERFEWIEASMRAAAERADRADERMDRAEKRADRADERMDRAEKRADRAEKRMEKFDQRMDRAELWMEKFDRRLEATRKLVEAGMKIVVRMEQRQKHMEIRMDQLTVTVRDLAKLQKAFLDSMRKGGNGSRHVA